MRLYLNTIYAVYVLEQGYRLDGEDFIILRIKRNC